MIRTLTFWFPSSNWIPTLLFTAGPVIFPFFSFNSCVRSPCRLILVPTCKVEMCWSNICLAFLVSLMLVKPCWQWCRNVGEVFRCDFPLAMDLNSCRAPWDSTWSSKLSNVSARESRVSTSRRAFRQFPLPFHSSSDPPGGDRSTPFVSQSRFFPPKKKTRLYDILNCLSESAYFWET